MSSNQFLWKIAKEKPAFVVITLFLTLSSAIFNGIGTALLIPILVVFLSDGEDYSLPENPPFLHKIFSIFDFFDGPQKLMIMLASVVVIIILKNVTNYLTLIIGNYHTKYLVNKMRLDGFDMLLKVGFDFYAKNKVGDITIQINREIERTAIVIRSGIKIIIIATTILTFVYFLLVISWQLTVISTALLSTIAFGNQSFVKMSRKYGRLLSEQSRYYSRKSFEIVTGIRLIKLTANEDAEYQKIKYFIDEREKIQLKSMSLSGLIGPLNEISGIIIILALIVICRYFFTPSIRDFAPTLLTYLVILFRLLPFIGQLNTARTQFANNYPSAEIVTNFLNRQDKPFLPSGELEFRGLRNAIKFENVSFAYPGYDSWVLDGVDIVIPKGKTVALVGSSGAGKSTIADLVPRFYDPNRGRITIDGIALSEFNLKSFRKEMGVVSQDTFMFNSTVRYNIAYGLEDKTEEDIINAIKQANAYDFIQNLPQGLDTEIGERGVMLSGGQRQRIAIARALLRNPQILILDEATSALDTVSERLVQEALEKLCHDRTTLVIAHRLSTVQKADRIVVLEKGKVIEAGTHRELLTKGGAYCRLYNMQFDKNDQYWQNHDVNALSHQMRTNLNSLIGHLQLAKEGIIGDTEEKYRILKESYSSAKDMIEALEQYEAEHNNFNF
ncbi:Xenobiotic-transporting ATPase [Hyella patelloides LEGE 07179]|uniref:Xenobiotic-transporting ATPase n=1 Tax=Hyella patelloides LEGE 07179 TaxID=945734 RepID=A0A563VJV7_9CYAN|nr:ATP-binding cassette domain-containing protein [Hyella patelloides]VEP11643.1 Xenobiotic-transporting ATPase [Hyella patelloides LEGE 07179]